VNKSEHGYERKKSFERKDDTKKKPCIERSVTRLVHIQSPSPWMIKPSGPVFLHEE
jgi:hypothetical protein